jgi:F0F1-type ATP synthase assembly protein I
LARVKKLRVGLERKSMNKYRTHHEAFWALVAQGIGFVTGLLILLVSLERANALSFGLGFLVCLLPNFVFYVLFFRYQGAQHLITIKNRFYLGEMVKLFLTAGMFALVWQIAWIGPVWVFCGYGVGLLCFFLPPIGINFIQITKADSKAG